MYCLGYYLYDGCFNVKAHGTENEMNDLLKNQILKVASLGSS